MLIFPAKASGQACQSEAEGNERAEDYETVGGCHGSALSLVRQAARSSVINKPIGRSLAKNAAHFIPQFGI
jgi:hypothetical protein